MSALLTKPTEKPKKTANFVAKPTGVPCPGQAISGWVGSAVGIETRSLMNGPKSPDSLKHSLTWKPKNGKTNETIDTSDTPILKS